MSEKFVSKFRFGCKPNLPVLGLRRLLLLKLTLMGTPQNRTIDVNFRKDSIVGWVERISQNAEK